MSWMTTQEAATKFCPLRTYPHPPTFIGDLKCLGDRCMGWTWDQPDKEYFRVPRGQKPAGEGWTFVYHHREGFSVWSRPTDVIQRKGHCGMVARPVRIDQVDTVCTTWTGPTEGGDA